VYRGERFNGYTHLAGAVLALAGAATLVTLAAPKGGGLRIASFCIYGATLVLLYVVSTLYHSLRGRAKDVLRKLDHCAIYLLIAGTYTPFALVALGGGWGWSLFGVSWGLATIGIVQECWLARGARLASLAIYLAMGWLALVGIGPLIHALGWHGFAWTAAGGLVYTAGIAFYALDERVAHFHGVWHLFVLGGSAVHFGAIVAYVAPLP
jgi:hemolysin III